MVYMVFLLPSLVTFIDQINCQHSTGFCLIVILSLIRCTWKPSQSYCDSFFCMANLDWRKICLVLRKTTINTKPVFHCKISNDVLCLNKILFKFWKIKSPLHFFCKSFEETTVHLFSNCSLSRKIWSQTQVFFSNYFNPLMPGGNKGHTYLNKPAAFSCRFV